MEAKSRCDITISIDCDGQDDINAMDAWWTPTATAATSCTACAASARPTRFLNALPRRASIKILNAMGAEVVFNHADYR